MGRFGRSLLATATAALAAVAVAVIPTVGASATSSGSVPRYDHLFVVVEENHGFQDVVGNPAAPNLNALAGQFGLATDYFGVTHPSEPNYVALLGGNNYSVNSDDPYYMQQVNKPSLITQLDQAGIGWKAYLQSLPYPGYQGICYPARCNGSPDNDPLYVSKHDAIQNFRSSLNPQDWSRQVPIEQLSADLGSGNVPSFGYIIPDECRDQHGDPPYCIDGGNPGDPQDQRLIAMGDQYLGGLVSSITSASFWGKGNNAIAIVYDEGDDNAGCCDANNGGGRVATVVVTSHGPRGVQDPTPANHYSLLQTIQRSFGLGCLAFTCDTTNVHPLSSLLAVTGSPAVATRALEVPNLAAPSPTPAEPVSSTTLTPSSGGWTVAPSPLLGTNDNSLGAVAAAGPTDVWAVGNFLPDTDTSNQDATLSLAVHYDGSKWTVTPTPNVGPNYNTLFGVAASQGRTWAVGVATDAGYNDRALVEAWNGSQWTVVPVPQPGAQRDLLFGASAASPSDVWAVGDQQGSDGKFETLVEHFDGTAWSVVPSPNPGSAGNHLYGVSAAGPDDVWAVGQQLSGAWPDQALVEHWDGTRWSVVPSPTHGGASSVLFGVAAGPGGPVVAGETDDALQGASPLVEELQGGSWVVAKLPAGAGSIFTDLWGVATSGSSAWAVGTYVNPVTDNNETLILQGSGGQWKVVHAPNPGSGSNILGGIAAVGGTLWAAGVYDTGGSDLTLIEHT